LVLALHPGSSLKSFTERFLNGQPSTEPCLAGRRVRRLVLYTSKQKPIDIEPFILIISEINIS